MKLKDVFEMAPYLVKGENPPTHWKKMLDVTVSKSALQRDYTFISSLTLRHQVNGVNDVHFYRLNDGNTIHGGYFEINEYNEERLKLIFTLSFKSKPTLKSYPKDVDKRHLLQVSKVNTDHQFERLGIASFVYQMLVKMGIIILSDTTQFDGGKGLWDKMIRRSHLSDYEIRILDDERGYRKDKDGKIISYDGFNIGEDEIWTSDLDFSGEHTLLMIRLKNKN